MHGLAMAAGVLKGSLFWSASAAFGMAAVMLANPWMSGTVRVLGACYLLYLAYKSARSAFGDSTLHIKSIASSGVAAAYSRGLLIHLTNPKAILFFGSLYSLGVPQDASISDLLKIIVLVFSVGFTTFMGYVLIFSNERVRAVYSRFRTVIELVFASFFMAAGLKLLFDGFSD